MIKVRIIIIQIGDLGVSKIVSNNFVKIKGGLVGTPLYSSPEIIKKELYNHKIDIWGVGCCLYYLACLEPPFKGENLVLLSNNIVNEKYNSELLNSYSSNLRIFIAQLLSKTPDNRPSALQAIELVGYKYKVF